MKKIIALAGVAAVSLTLAACGGNDADEPTEAVIADDTAVEASSAGTYTAMTEEGNELVIALNEDGSYAVTEAGDQVEAGTWEDTEEGTCWTAEGGEEATCATFAPSEEEGMVDMTSPDGSVMSFSYES